jgi:hypothetical protein
LSVLLILAIVLSVLLLFAIVFSVLLLLAIVLSVLLRITDSDYFFVIFKLFLMLTNFSKLKIMSEVEHGNWPFKKIKTVDMFHISVFDRGNSSLKCFNLAIHNYSVVATGSISS